MGVLQDRRTRTGWQKSLTLDITSLTPIIWPMTKITDQQIDAKNAAIKKAGSISSLAKALIPKATDDDKKRLEWAISKWKVVPPHWVLPVERVTGISRHLLRNDLYPKEAA